MLQFKKDRYEVPTKISKKKYREIDKMGTGQNSRKTKLHENKIAQVHKIGR